jgi:hypothetical protein
MRIASFALCLLEIETDDSRASLDDGGDGT